MHDFCLLLFMVCAFEQCRLFCLHLIVMQLINALSDGPLVMCDLLPQIYAYDHSQLLIYALC